MTRELAQLLAELVRAWDAQAAPPELMRHTRQIVALARQQASVQRALERRAS